MADDLIRQLREARRAEKSQALFYRALASEAERRDDAGLSERFNELHADEQHHLSRITARLLELGEPPGAVDDVEAERVDLDGWAGIARGRERDEVFRYESLLAEGPDPETEALVRAILETERHHVTELGGKWTPAA